MSAPERRLAEAIRAACLAAAREAYEDAGIRGLCAEGRWEAALAAISSLDLSERRCIDSSSSEDEGRE